MADLLRCVTTVLAVGLCLVASGCVTVKRDVELSCEASPVDPDWNPAVAPYYFRDRVDLFSESLRASSSEITVVDAAVLWAEVFPDRDPDADASVSEFRQGDIVDRVADADIRHLIVLGMERHRRDQPVGVTILYNTQKESTTSEAVLVSFSSQGCTSERFRAVAEGRDHIAWYVVGVHFDADTQAEALRAVTDRMAAVILQASTERPVKVVIVAAR